MACEHCSHGHCGIEQQKHVHEDNKVMWIRPGIALLTAIAAGAADTYGVFQKLGAGDGLAGIAVLAVYIAAYLVAGGDVVLRAFTNIIKGEIFDENFLMTVATIGAFFIGEYPEAVGVMVFYQIGEIVQDYAAEKSRKSISSLMDIRPLSARKLIDGNEQIVLPETLGKGDMIVVRPGDRIAADGVIVSGHSFADMSALTGESVPREICEGDTVLGGSVNVSGVITVKVLKPYAESAAAKILELTEHASSRKASREKFITRFARWYTPAVTGAAVLLAVVPPLLIEGAQFSDWIYRALVFLVVSCPCALVLSVPLGFFAGIGAAAREGILVKGGNFLEALAKAEIAVFDKTGTLTKGEFKVSAVHPADRSSESLSALAAHAERFSAHPVSQPLREAHTEVDGCCSNASNVNVEEIAGHGVSAVINGNTVLAGSARLMKKYDVAGFASDGTCSACASEQSSGTFVHVAENGQYAGHIIVSDQLKNDAADALVSLKKNGVKKTVILTGDAHAAALDAAKKTGVDEVYAELLPQGKVDKVETLLRTLAEDNGGTLMFVGDGINDAPVLAMADVGIAMGGIGSDAAIEAADVVIMNDEPSKAARAVQIAKRTVRIVTENIVFVLVIKGFVLALGAFGYAPMWAAVFADAGTAAIAALNSVRVLNVRREPKK